MCSVPRSDKISYHRTQLTVSSVGGFAESRLVILKDNMKTPNLELLRACTIARLRVSVEALADQDMISDRIQRS